MSGLCLSSWMCHSQTKAHIEKQLKEKSNTFMGGFLNTQVSNPTRYIGIEAKAFSNGWGVGLRYGKGKKTWSIALQEWKHDKEEKLNPSLTEIEGLGKPLPYRYGKINSFYSLNMQYGYSTILVKGLVAPSIDVSFQLQGGLSLGFLKPYYLQVNTQNSLSSYHIVDMTYSTNNAEYFLNTRRVYSRSSFSNGIKDTRFIAGLILSPSIAIDLGNHSVWLKKLQFGSSCSLYSSSVALMADDSPKFNNLNWFMGVVVGKGW